MEFLFGLIVGLVVYYFAIRLVSAEIKASVPVKISYRQSDVFNALQPALQYLEQDDVAAKDTQATRFYDKDNVRVLVYNDQAYWIKDNAIFTGQIINGNIDQSNAEKVNTMTMDKDELKKIIFIVQELTKGKNNDRRNPGY